MIANRIEARIARGQKLKIGRRAIGHEKGFRD
jgi:hypothetical protein